MGKKYLFFDKITREMRVEIFCALKGKSFRTLNCIAPLAEYAEYHPFHREKVFNRIHLSQFIYFH